MPLLFAERLRFMQTRNADEMQRPKPLHLKNYSIVTFTISLTSGSVVNALGLGTFIIGLFST